MTISSFSSAFYFDPQIRGVKRNTNELDPPSDTTSGQIYDMEDQTDSKPTCDRGTQTDFDLPPQRQIYSSIERVIDQASLGYLHEDVLPIISGYVYEEWMDTWYKGLQELNMLPETIPSLPRDIFAQFISPSVFNENKLLQDTHLLILISNRFNSLRHINRVIKNRTDKYESRSLAFDFGTHEKQFKEYIHEPFDKSYWLLMPKEGLIDTKGIRSEFWNEAISFLTARAPEYRLPTMQEFISSHIVVAVATRSIRFYLGEEFSLFGPMPKEEYAVVTYTQEDGRECKAVAGAWNSRGIRITTYDLSSGIRLAFARQIKG